MVDPRQVEAVVALLVEEAPQAPQDPQPRLDPLQH
jgi:hypothetical protein